MASKFQAERDEKVKLHPKKGDDMTWSCDIHGEPIAFYCKEHGLPVCERCAFNDHQKPCHIVSIGDVIFELIWKLDDKRLEIEETKPKLQNLDSKIQTCLADTRNHLQSIDDAANATFENKMKTVKDKERDNIRSINEEVDKEIQIINGKRERRIKSCQEEAEQQQLPIKESQAKLESEIKAIGEVMDKKNQHAISTMDNVDATIKRIKQDDKTLVNEAHQVLASLDDILNVNVHQYVSDCLDRIQREVQKVKFVEGEVGGEHYGIIDGYIGELYKWELVKSIHIPSIVNGWVRGLISDDEICVVDVHKDSYDTYVTNISTEHTHKVIEGGSMYIDSCASVDSNVIVCGKSRRGGTGDSLDGCITLYDRQWKVIRDISIPMNNRCMAWVYVDVNRDGMILAAQDDQSNIYVINPADGKIVNTITMQDKVVKGEIQSLSSGDIVVMTGSYQYTVISRSGEEKAAIYSDEWSTPWCSVNKRTDTLYITYRDDEHTIYTVDEVSCDGIIQARRIMEYEISDRAGNISPFFVTPSGSLVSSNGNFVCVYRKMFCV